MVTLALLMAVVIGPARASLLKIGTADIAGVGTGYGLIYDSGTSLFWLDYTHSVDTWLNQVDWATSLVLTNVLTPGKTIQWTDPTWRLPTTVPAISGSNQTGSEMGRLYYTDLGIAASVGVNVDNQLPFKNILSSRYWSGTESASDSRNAWRFTTADGLQDAASKRGYLSALAVRPGQLETSAVPEPSTYALLCISLGVVGYARRKMGKQG